MGETRKLAAIMAVDVVGYSRLMGQDEAGTAKAVRERREAAEPIVGGFGGRVVKTMGDGLLVEFASVVAAVECAAAIQKMMVERNREIPATSRIVYRIGVHLGDVLVDGDDILGEGVNIAARLEGVAEPGSVCVSGSAYEHVRGRIETGFVDLGEKKLKNIAQPVRVYALKDDAVGDEQTRPALRSAGERVTLAILGTAGLLAVCAAGGYMLFASRPATVTTGSPALVAAAPSAPSPSEAKHLSLVVLPFKNLSGDPAQDYFADGVTDNLTTDLSHIRNSFVIASTTALTYKGKTVDAREIGKELGVRYVLEGSVQRDQGRVRVNAQLIDAETGAHLWAERFEEDLADLFKLQDEVVGRLSNTLGVELVRAEAEKAARSGNPDVVDLTMRGNALFQRQPLTKENNDAAKAAFEQALKVEPDNVDALIGDAAADLHEVAWGWKRSDVDYDAKILGQADRAIALAPNNALSYYTKSYYLFTLRRADEALRAANAGLAINPNSAMLYGVRALVQNSLGRFAEAKSDIMNAMRLSPHDPFMLFWLVYLGDAELGLRNLDAAIEAYRRSIDVGNCTFAPYVDLSAAYALQSKMDDAKAALAEARRLNPSLTVKWLQSVAPNIPNLFEGVRKAGLPEDAPPEPAHLSIVVLPFANLSGDPSQDYFADGVTENLTTDLSRVAGSFVIARNTAFTYKGKSVDAKQIGKELSVRYVLEGSVQRDQNRVRVNAQLVDAETGAHLWADRFDEEVGDLFKLQDQVIARLGNALGFELVKAEAAKSAPSRNSDAIDLAMRGWATMWRSYPMPPKEKRENHDAALNLFDEALKVDPNDADALAGEAFAHMAKFIFGEEETGANQDASIIEPADRAIALAPDDMRAYVAKSFYLAVTGRAAEALRVADSGLAIDPNSAPLLDARALAENVLGRFEQAKADAEQAVRLSPRDPEIPNRLITLGTAELGLGSFVSAVDEFQKAIDAGDHSFIPYVNLAAAYALAGKTEEANTALAQARRLNPLLSVKWLANHAPNVTPLFDGVRKAGLPDELPSEPAHLSIVVLPFANLSGDPSQDYFADGVTENLTTDLSRVAGSFVIARNTAFTYKGKSVDAKQIGKELSVRYVLEGSVQRDQNRVRVNAQLVDAETGAHLWADRFDEEVGDLFKLQDEIVARLANSLNLALTSAEAAKGARSKNPDVIDLRIRGWDLINLGFAKPPQEQRDGFHEARDFFNRALAIDPDDAEALAGSALTYFFDYIYGWGDPGTDYDSKVLGQANRAINLAPGDPRVYIAKAFYLAISGRNGEALSAADAGLAANPNYPSLYQARAIAETSLGRYEQAKADLEQAMRISPRDPVIGLWHENLGDAEMGLGRFDAAIDEYRKALDMGFRAYFIHTNLAAAYAQSGKMDEAKAALVEALRLNPAITVKWMKEHSPNLPAVFDGLQKAGLPKE